MMLFTLRISLFADPEHFKREIDRYVRQTRQLRPLEGSSGAYLPGGIEAEHERAYRGDGIPLSDSHLHDLEWVAEELSIEMPWQ
jgi:LDH2 family malate/lactate/ureidoglycolate dehydrogenase